ncbi:MAG: citramalate synthase [Hyphomicrobiales bacterium]|nr:citramalate synthase [Hyphomicrobiales bacterium]
MAMGERIYIYDSTLRDGAQTQDVDFSIGDKHELAQEMDVLVDYIEGGWPGANPTDDGFFANLPPLKRARMVAFGMTRRPKTSAANDPGLNALVNSGVGAVCIVGKSWDFQVTHALKIGLDENLAMIAESLAYLKRKGLETLFDAEHFFDGYKANPDYAMQTIKAAYDNGARWVVLCDTNGGTLPHEVEAIVKEVAKVIPGDHLGIHCHNDTENAVANSLAAVRAGVRQVQGTIDGYGERCGNANLISIIPTLALKMGYDTGISPEGLAQLTKVARGLDNRLNRPHYRHAAYVGSSAFAHKGGLHVSAVLKHPESYEHIQPEQVGNTRQILVSDQAGRSNIVNRLNGLELGVDLDSPENKDKITALVDDIKEREKQGFAYDSADASFELLARSYFSEVAKYYTMLGFRVLDERRWNAKGELITLSEATIKLKIDGKTIMSVAEGNGPVNALNMALKKALIDKYPVVSDIKLTDYKVRILRPELGTGAVTRVQIEFRDASDQRWTTVGVSTNIIDASYNALQDGVIYKLIKTGL